MKQNIPVRNLIRKASAVKALPLLIAEFNFNRYATPTADNQPADSVDARNPDYFPMESIIGPNRPPRGHMKAAADSAVAIDYSPVPPAVRHHVAEQEDYYQYWSSPDQSAATGTGGNYDLPANANTTMPTGCNPQVTYSTVLKANKIVIGLENSVVSPSAFTIHIQTTVGGAWTLLGDQSNITVDPEGRIIFYRGTSAWSQTKTLGNTSNIAGIQMRVTKLDKPNSYFQLIEMAALLEYDLTDYMTTTTDTFDLGDINVLSPIGKISSNSASISLFNGLVDESDYGKGLMFNQDNVNSPLYGLMNENVKFTLDYIFDASGYAGTSEEVIRQYVMYADQDWGGDLAESVSVAVRDFSKYLQEIKCPETFYATKGVMTIGEIIWRLLDNVGFLHYNIEIDDVEVPLTMDFFWCNGEKYVWDILNELAEATQTAIYFDNDGILQVKTKEVAFNSAATPVWTLRGAPSGDELDDIMDIQNEVKDISNSIKVNYRPTDYKRTANNNIMSQVAWEPPTEDVILRSSDLVEAMTETSTYVRIPAADATNWQYTGMMNIEGEVISYEGKEYTYIDSTDGNQKKYATIKSLSDYNKYYFKTNAENQFQNAFTGKLFIKERGMWNTYPAPHILSPANYSVLSTRSGSVYKTVYGYYYSKKRTKPALQNKDTGFTEYNSFVRLMNPTTCSASQALLAIRGTTTGDSPNFFGTRMRIVSAGKKHNAAGLIISAGGGSIPGYLIEVRPTANTSKNTKEITILSKTASGDVVRKNGVGWRANIVKGYYFNLDVQFSNTGTNHYIWVWLNGRLLGRCRIDSTRQTNSDRFGMYVRGSSAADYEYLYAYEHTEVTDTQFWGDDVSFYDRVINGYVSNQSLNEFTYKTRPAIRRVKRKNVKYTQRYDTKWFDEFGPVVHEMREYDVKFETALPGLSPKLLVTNDATAKFLDFRATPFGAHFYAVNVSHDDVNIHGTLNDVNQVTNVVMKSVEQGEVQVVTAEDEESIRVNGKKELEIASDWIQSEDQANAISSWVKSHWDHKTDEVTVTIFGNPLIQLTDVVLINDPQSNRDNVKYFVIAASTDFASGLGTTLRLRKVRI